MIERILCTILNPRVVCHFAGHRWHWVSWSFSVICLRCGAVTAQRY